MVTLKRGTLSVGFTLLFAVALTAFVLIWLSASADAQTKIRVGRTVGASGFHFPSYVAQDKGMFREEGLQAEFIAAEGGPL
ncbi:MAG: hypothetical protein HYV04_21870, partial [Deltaproteobacteria bacterium]|nr:hypothetical protein [Deltaproteobacteria bacterium]